MKRSILILTFAIAGLLLAGCNKAGRPSGDSRLSAEDQAMKALVEQYVPGVIYNIYGKLADETESLHTLLQDLKAKAKAGTLTDADLAKAQESFYAARQWWEKSEAFLYGAATVYKIDPHIDSWPLDKTALAKNLQNKAVVEDLDAQEGGAIGLVGADALGFHGIEFILFRDGAIRKASDFLGTDRIAGYTIDGVSELVFATAVADDLMGYCFELQAAWDPSDYPYGDATRRAYVEEELELPTAMDGNGMTFGENLLATATLGSTYRAWTVAVNAILVAGCSNICNEVANTKLATAHGAEVADEDDVDADYNYIESPYSKRSFHDFKDNLLSIQYTLYGGNGADAPTGKSLMGFLGDFGYSGAKQLDDSLKAAIASMDACIAVGSFVDNRNDASVDKAIETINALDAELNKAAAWVMSL